MEGSFSFWFIYYVSLRVENCPEAPGKDLNGEYTGSGALTEIVRGSNEQDSLLLGVDNEEQAILLMLERI